MQVRLGGEGGGAHVPGLSQHCITSLPQALSLMADAAAARAQARTDMNESSSRSHCVVTVCATTTDKITGQRATGKKIVFLAQSISTPLIAIAIPIITAATTDAPSQANFTLSTSQAVNASKNPELQGRP